MAPTERYLLRKLPLYKRTWLGKRLGTPHVVDFHFFQRFSILSFILIFFPLSQLSLV